MGRLPKSGKSVIRKDLQPKTVSLHVLLKKAGENRDRIEKVEQELQILTQRVIVIENIINNNKEKCPYCGKEFKDLKRHKCKSKPNND
ncbi:MAG: hypothetical protein ACFFAO_18515 [Candidatus Hermodarchaeota archaeon]